MKRICVLFIVPIIICSCWNVKPISSYYPYNVDDWSHINSCDNAVTDSNTVTCGGQTYKTVRIGSQTWMAENLNYNEKDGSYDNSPYGRYYHWYHARLICPSGWHLPDSADWVALIDFVGSGAGTKLKAKSGWDENGNGTDDYGFSALPGGIRIDIPRWHGSIGSWWSSNSSLSSNYPDTSYFFAQDWEMHSGISYVEMESDAKGVKRSVRCVQNPTTD